MLAGESVSSITRDLSARGVETSRGGPFSETNLTRMMVRPRNGGHVEHRGQIVGTIPGEPILDPATYDDLVAMVNAKRRGRRPTGHYLLTGLVQCGRCGHAMTGYTVWKNGRRSYMCPPQRGGCSRSARADELEAMVADYMTDLLSDPAAVEGVAKEEAALSAVRAEQLAKVDAIEEQLADLEVKYAAGEIIRRAYERARPVLEKRLTKAQDALDGIGRTKGTPYTLDPAGDWAAMTYDEKRALIAALHVNIVVNDTAGGRYFRPERVNITRP
jgi:hypothetical protein